MDKNQLEQAQAMINTSLYKALHGVPKNTSFKLHLYMNSVYLSIYDGDTTYAQTFTIMGVDYITDYIKMIDDTYKEN